MPTLEQVVTDGTASIGVVFYGRREIPGITLGTELRLDGTVADQHGRLAMLNPTYTLLRSPHRAL